MNCTNCGASLPPDTQRCLKCGSYVESSRPQSAAAESYGPPPPPPLLPVLPVKSRQTAAILGFVLGGLGVHRFYLGYITIGLVQFCLTVFLSWCTVGVTALVAIVWGIIEGVMILNGQISRDADGRPLIE